MLHRALVLVAEDEPFIACDLALAIEDQDGEVAGPAASVKEALSLIRERLVAGAILDANLTDGDVSPVVEILAGSGIPVIVQTGVGLPQHLTRRFPDLIVHLKPCVAAALVAELAGLIADWRTRGVAVVGQLD
jgi:DNA-binding response OmpR family regulator